MQNCCAEACFSFNTYIHIVTNVFVVAAAGVVGGGVVVLVVAKPMER